MYPYTFLTAEMYAYACGEEADKRVDRDRMSRHDTIIGICGELVFLKYWFGDWRGYTSILGGMGQVDLNGIVEIKASATSLQGPLHLLAKEEYVEKREPEVYVQVIFDTTDGEKNTLVEGMKAAIIGWATHWDVLEAKTMNFKNKNGSYSCKAVPVKDLNPAKELKSYLDEDIIRF